MTDLDPFEKNIIRELQRDASLTTAEPPSASGCRRPRAGAASTGWNATVISGAVAVIDRRKVGLHAPVSLRRSSSAHGRATLQIQRRSPPFPKCSAPMCVGNMDFMLRIVAIDAYEAFLRQIEQAAGVQEINSTGGAVEIKSTNSCRSCDDHPFDSRTGTPDAVVPIAAAREEQEPCTTC